jgi:hypothetical protein
MSAARILRRRRAWVRDRLRTRGSCCEPSRGIRISLASPLGRTIDTVRQRGLDYFELLAIAAILLGVAIIAGIVFTYDLSRQTVLDDTRAQAQLYSKQLPDDL